ncbi:substrate-binding domain-containing protein [Streptacidiphilus sp. ASG 303]|uniref:PstS family phosphate ABC transporter substrate-binding protein n=1 Tax=Streptacidiphilus sp. ASG 303 TaxID=2896847 RepID=UPI001E51DD08|nr:substrate-binding domain-containing protein [Streptacidiphilus sp. ASG 303]MCD0485995.1 substrate-binding domain-containing protein [Streptacidiphilus sp. ASG 303]
MDWLSPDNVVAVLTALLSTVAPPAVTAVYRRGVQRGRRIGYRVQMDTPIGSDHRGGHGQPNVRLGLFNDLPDMSDATLVLLRIENDGAEAVAEADYTGPDPLHGLTAVFTDRVVRGAAVTQLGAAHLMGHLAAPGAMRHTGNALHLPRVPLNRGEHYKLLVLLTGGGVGCAVRVDGGLRDGAVVPNRSTTVDDRPPALSGPARGIVALLTAGVLVLAGVIVASGDGPPRGCATGRLTLLGATAFRPVLEGLAREYARDCPGSGIALDLRGSDEGVRELVRRGEEAGGGAPAVVAFSDGPAREGAPRLAATRVAVSAFAVVVNDRVPVRSLSGDRIRALYDGSVLDWSQVGGPRLPVRLVSRRDGSGTRSLFERLVLDRTAEPPRTSTDCTTPEYPNGRFRGVRCERGSTEEVLQEVAAVPGAVGYGELQAAARTRGLHVLGIDGRAPSPGAIRDGSYPFTEVEYAYTYGDPAGGSLAASFLDFAARGRGQEVLAAHRDLPCYSPEGFARCAP